MGTRGSPDIYTLSPRASGVYIRQTTLAHGITIKYVPLILAGGILVDSAPVLQAL